MYQNLKDSIGNNPPTPDKYTLDFDSVFIISKMQASPQGKDNFIRQLKKQLSQLQVTRSDTNSTLTVQTTDSQITKLTKQVTNLQAQNDMFRAENDKIKQHYKEFYDSIKITRAKHIENVTNLTTENMNLQASVSKDQVKPKVLARGKYSIDIAPIIPHLRNNRDAHLDYLRHLKESVETNCDIVEEAKVEGVRPLDRSIVSACRYTKHSQELLEYTIGTCPQGSQQRAKQLVYIPLIKKTQVTVAKPSDNKDLGKLQPTSNIGIFSGYAPSRKGYRIYNKRTQRIMEIIHVQFDELTVQMAPVHLGIGPAPNFLTPGQISSGLVPNPVSVTPYAPPPIKNWRFYFSQCSMNIWNLLVYKMADLNAPSGQTPALAPPLRADDQILPHIRWVPIRKSNCYLDLEKSQSNPIYRIAVSAGRTMVCPHQRNLEGSSSYHTGQNDQAFATPPSIDGLIDFVNQLGYPKLVRNLSNVVTNDFVLTIEGTLNYHQLVPHGKDLWFHPRLDSPLHLANEEPVLGYLKFSAKGMKREVFGMLIPGSLIIAEIQQASYYQEYLAKVAQHRRYLAGEIGGVQDPRASKPTQPARKPKTTAPKAPSRPSVSIPVRLAQPAPTSALANLHEKRRKQATETSDKPPKEKKSKHGWVSKKRSRKNVESMKDAFALPRGTLPPVVIREPESGKYQPLPQVPGKGKAKVTEDQVAHDLLSLQKYKKTSHADQYIFQRAPEASRTAQVPPSAPPPSSTNQESPSKGSSTPSPSKTAALAEYQAWMTTDIRLRPSISLTPADLEMDEDMAPDEQVQSSDNEDIESAYIPTVNLRQGWWKPFEEERSATPDSSQRITGHQLWRLTIHPLLKTRYLRRPVTLPHLWTGFARDEELLSLSLKTWKDLLMKSLKSFIRIKGSRPVLSISKMKAAYYPDAGLEQMVPDQFWIEEECKYDIAAMAAIFWDKYGVQMMMRVNEIHKFSDGRFKYEVLDQEGRGSEEGIYVRYSAEFEDKEDLSQPEKPSNELTDAFGKPFEVLNNVFEHWVFNSLVYSSRALSALRCSGLRMASTAAKPCQEDSLEFYLITDSIHTDQRGTVVLATLFNRSKQRHFRLFITNINLQESRRLQLLAKKDVNSRLNAHTSNSLSMTAKRPTTQLPQL
nr:integrase, catalytic region, zinc finger, CCHC-type, peptidase aspartic, catalytic [Tanacetum cinerariifolium]